MKITIQTKKTEPEKLSFQDICERTGVFHPIDHSDETRVVVVGSNRDNKKTCLLINTLGIKVASINFWTNKFFTKTDEEISEVIFTPKTKF